MDHRVQRREEAGTAALFCAVFFTYMDHRRLLPILVDVSIRKTLNLPSLQIFLY